MKDCPVHPCNCFLVIFFLVVFCLDNGGSIENNEATGVCDSGEMWKKSKLWSVAASLAVVYFFSPECFGRKA